MPEDPRPEQEPKDPDSGHEPEESGPEEDPGPEQEGEPAGGSTLTTSTKRSWREVSWGWFYRTVLRSRLERYLDAEEASWGQEGAASTKDLILTLKSRHEASRAEGARDTVFGLIFSALGFGALALAVSVALQGWGEVISCLRSGSRIQGPDSTIWPFLAATTGTVLLITGAGGLLFRVASSFSQRGHRYSDDASDTKRIEAAIRLTMVSEGSPETRLALRDLGIKLLEPRTHSFEESGQDFSAMPELVKEIRKLFVEVGKSVGSKGD